MELNILFISSFRIDANRGGVQRVTEALAKEFQAIGLVVCYLSLCKGEFEIVNDIEQYYIPMPRRLDSQQNKSFVASILQEKKINIVINQAGIYKAIINFIHKSIPKNVRIFTVHHNCIECLHKHYRSIVMSSDNRRGILKYIDYKPVWQIMSFLSKNRYSQYFRNAIKKSHRLVLLSNFYKPELIDLVGHSYGKSVIAIPNPAPFILSHSAVLKKENRLLYVGRVEYAQKRIDILFEIWKRIYMKYPDWQLDIVGDGSYLEWLKRKIALNKVERINLVGFHDPKEFYQRSKLLCLTSDFEGFGMVLIEAQTYGAVPIAFKCYSGIEQIIEDDYNGFLIEGKDIESYIDTVERLINNPENLSQMSINCRNSVRNFNVQTVGKNWVSAFNSSLIE